MKYYNMNSFSQTYFSQNILALAAIADKGLKD